MHITEEAKTKLVQTLEENKADGLRIYFAGFG